LFSNILRSTAAEVIEKRLVQQAGFDNLGGNWKRLVYQASFDKCISKFMKYVFGTETPLKCIHFTGDFSKFYAI
jgi:hypothetical protein